MDLDTTIVAVSSPLGQSSKAIIRATGTGVFKNVEQLGLHVCSSQLVVGRLKVDSQLLPVLVGGFSSGASYTGQETLEIQCPNNQTLIKRVMKVILQATGGRLATAGEFTARAFFNGRLTLTQAEGVCATISANNDAELRGASLLRDGALAMLIEPIALELTTSLSLVEAGIDFTDEEGVVAIESSDLQTSIERCIDGVNCILEGKISMASLRQLPQVVIAGAPNAGKSTLFNALVGKRRVVVTSVAGTTRDAIVEPALFVDKEALLIDIAGLETSTGAIETAAQNQAQCSIDQAEVVLFCIAPNEHISKVNAKTLIVHTKGDLTDSHDDAICATRDTGIEELKKRIAAQLQSMPNPHQDALALLPRHEQHLQEALSCLHTAKKDVTTEELVANSLRAALNEIGSITGQVTPDEVLGHVFASFCVGK